MQSAHRRLITRIPAMMVALAYGSTSAPLSAQTSVTYQVPPTAIVALVDTKPTPYVDVSPPDSAGRKWLISEYLSGLATIADLAQPELRLAGLRFNPRTGGPSRGRYMTAFGLEAWPAGKEIAVRGRPASARMRFAAWAPDARHFSFVNVSDAAGDAGLSLWVVDVETAQAHRIAGIALNGVFGPPCEWLPDSRGLVCLTLAENRGAAPKRSEMPLGPVVQQNLGRVTPGPTFEDLLKSPEDETLFDYYASSQVRLVRLDGSATAIGAPGVITAASASPDGKYVLIDERHHPYSYLLPFDRFPQRISVINLGTGATRQLADKPLEDTVPNIHDAVETGPRDFVWRSDTPATVCWVEASDGGDPHKEVAVRDTVFLVDAPFEAAPRKLVELPLRLKHITWSSNRLAIVEETRWRDRKRIILGVAPAANSAPMKWFEGSFEDRYHDPGTPFTVMNAAGKDIAQTTPDASAVYFHGMGASAEGDRPFVATIRVTNGEARQMWRSAAPYFAMPAAVLDARGPMLLIERESPELSPNYYVMGRARNSWDQVTFFPNPYAETPLPHN